MNTQELQLSNALGLLQRLGVKADIAYWLRTVEGELRPRFCWSYTIPGPSHRRVNVFTDGGKGPELIVDGRTGNGEYFQADTLSAAEELPMMREIARRENALSE
jgi:hypothetical protein